MEATRFLAYRRHTCDEKNRFVIEPVFGGGRVLIVMHGPCLLRPHTLVSLQYRDGEQRWGGHTHVMHGRSRMTIDPRIPTMPGRSTSGFHRPDRHWGRVMRRERVIYIPAILLAHVPKPCRGLKV